MGGVVFDWWIVRQTESFLHCLFIHAGSLHNTLFRPRSSSYIIYILYYNQSHAKLNRCLWTISGCAACPHITCIESAARMGARFCTSVAIAFRSDQTPFTPSGIINISKITNRVSIAQINIKTGYICVKSSQSLLSLHTSCVCKQELLTSHSLNGL